MSIVVMMVVMMMVVMVCLQAPPSNEFLPHHRCQLPITKYSKSNFTLTKFDCLPEEFNRVDYHKAQ